MEVVAAVAALVIGIGIGRWTKKGRTLDEEAQSLKDARMALKADPANTEPGDPRRPLPEYWATEQRPLLGSDRASPSCT